MGLKEMQIMFDNPWATYYAGGTVGGQIVLKLDSPKKVRDININIKGASEVSWSESESVRGADGKDTTEWVTYRAEEKYFENSFVLLGGGGDTVEVPAGEHKYSFQTILPPSVPSSFESEHGHVRYTVKCVLNRPWKFDQEAKAAFTVISPLDLNYNQQARYPIKKDEEKSLGCCCFYTGQIAVTLSAPVTGYVSGQHIPIMMQIDNKSSSQVTEIICQLRKVVKYTAKSPSMKTKELKVTIAEIKTGGVAPQQNNVINETILIPALPPSNLQNCTIIDLKYDLKMEVKVSGMFVRNLVLHVPLIIGTVPLVDQQQQLPPLAKTGVDVPPPPTVGWNAPDNSLYPNIPPPSYEECAFGTASTIRDQHDNKYTIGQETFAPRYPSYQVPIPSAPTLQ